MNRTARERVLFVSWAYSEKSYRDAKLMVESIRRFGGDYCGCPVWVYVPESKDIANQDRNQENVEIKSLKTPGRVRDYYYAHKVFACAQAEQHAGPEMQSLVWVSPEILFTNPPVSFDLGRNFKAAFRPVHIQNVGLRVDESVDLFWEGVYQRSGSGEPELEVESFVDRVRLRAYFNSAAFALKPGLGLCRRWFELFQELVMDPEYQRAACQDERHKVFLHQAVLSVLVSAEAGGEGLRLLSPDYIYPYNLHLDVSPSRRARSLDELACMYYEGRSLKPGDMTDIEVPEPYRSWLAGFD